MAVTRISTINANAVGLVINAGPCRVSAIHIDAALAGVSANSFVMLYDQTAAPTTGTDTPAFVHLVETAATRGLKGREKVIFPGGGRRFATGVGLGVTTTFNGATGVGATGPTSIDVFWEP